MTTEETLVKEALERQAATAPGPERLRAALAGAPPRGAPPRRTLPRRLVLVPLAAVAAAAVVVTPLVMFRDGPPAASAPPATATSTPGPTTAPADLLFTGTDVPLDWGSPWLPAGFTEVIREASGSQGDRSRSWRKGNDLDTASWLTLTRTVQTPHSVAEGAPVDIGGVEGRLVSVDGGDKQIVQWAADGDHLTLVGVGLAPADFLEVARSVAPDPLARLTVPITAEVPGGLAVESVSLERAGQPVAGDERWTATVSFTPGGRNEGGGLVVRVVAGSHLFPDLAPAGSQVLVTEVPLADGRVVQVQRDTLGGWTHDDALAVARSVKLLRDPDPRWTAWG